MTSRSSSRTVSRKVSRYLDAASIIASGACASRGKEVFVREGCVNCHRFRELGSGGAPALSEVREVHLRQLFAGDPKRGERLTA